jgi:hypothetical protein
LCLIDDPIEKKTSDRRSFIRKLARVAALGGLASVVMGQVQKQELLPTVHAANSAGGAYSGIGAGDGNTTYDDYNLIGGGQNNTAGSSDGDTTTQKYAMVGGGLANTASAASAIVGGGQNNTASGLYSLVGGGSNNTASGHGALVGGGGYDGTTTAGNVANGRASTVLGGLGNAAGADYSFAAGSKANVQASHHGAMLFSDDSSLVQTFNSTAADEFAVRCTGGARFVTSINGLGNPTQQLTLLPNGNLGVNTTSPAFNIHAVGTTDPASITVDGIGIVGPNFQFRRARGTRDNPTAVQANDGLLFLVAKGYGVAGFSGGGRANLSMFAAENWTDTAQGTYMIFKTTQAGTATQTEKMRITDTGNVGIGTTTPNPAAIPSWSPVLTLGPSATTNSASIVELQSNSTSNSGLGALVFRNTAVIAGDNRVVQIQGNRDEADDAGTLLFYTRASGGSLSERMRIDTNGRVGVGMASPSSRLHVSSDSATSGETGIIVEIPGIGTKRILIGPADSAGTGYRSLRVTN